jgi:hypothetical protein
MRAGPFGGARGFGGGCGNNYGYGYGYGGGCGGGRRGRQTLAGMAINAAVSAIEKKNEERNARAAALSAPASVVVSRQGQGYEDDRLGDLVRDLTLGDDEEKTGRTNERAVVVPEVRDGEAPPAYTPTAAAASAPAPAPALTAQTSRAVVQSEDHPAKSGLALPINSPLLTRHAAHPIIVADLRGLEAALTQYRGRECGGGCAVKRARKNLVRDLALLEVERFRREEGAGRRELKRRAREVKMEGRVIREGVRRAMRA